MIICFYGTDKKAVKRILREGFQKDIYFARQLEDALEFGGPYVFFVRFEENEFVGLRWNVWWQFHPARAIPATKIEKVVKYSQLLIHNNQGK